MDMQARDIVTDLASSSRSCGTPAGVRRLYVDRHGMDLISYDDEDGY